MPKSEGRHGLSRIVIKSHPEEKWAWTWATGAPQNLGFPFNGFAMVDVAMAVPNKRY